MKKRSDKHRITANLIFILSFLLFLPLVSSYDLKIPTNESSCNITIAFSNSTDLIINGEMSINTGYANYSFNPPDLGDYHYYSNCGYGTINPSGETLTTSKGILYFLVTLFAFGIFFLLGWLFLNIKGENPKDETGYLGINYRKYLKCALFPLVYISFLWAFNFIIGLSNNYLGLTLYSNTLEFMFMVLSKLIYPVIVLTIIIMIVLMVKDANIEKEYKSLWSPY